MNNFWDTLNLMQLPLSAYTPGQGDPKMEGGNETATGAPVYTFEMWRRGVAPYVTGATSEKDPPGTLVYRTVGEHQQVPVRITDYGPGVKGIDIASSNSKWATNFPFQGATDQFSETPPLLARPSEQMDSARPMPAAAPGVAQMSSWSDYASVLKPTATESTISGVGGALSKLGGGMMQQGQQGMQQALAGLFNQSHPAAALLQQYANNPLQFLANPYLRG